MMLELTRAGHNEVAYDLINNRTFPSWGYSIENGATTIWERWDGYVKGRGFQDKGNEFVQSLRYRRSGRMDVSSHTWNQRR